MSEGRDIEGKKEESLLSFAPAVAGPDCGSWLSERLTRVIVEEWDASRFASMANGEMEMEMEMEYGIQTCWHAVASIIMRTRVPSDMAENVQKKKIIFRRHDCRPRKPAADNLPRTSSGFLFLHPTTISEVTHLEVTIFTPHIIPNNTVAW